MNYKPRSLRFIDKPDGSRWISIIFSDGRIWVPALDDLAFAFGLIGKCEDWKYLPRGGEGYNRPKRFVGEAMDIIHGMTEQEIKNNGMRAIENLYRKYDENGLYRKDNNKSINDSLTTAANKGWENA
jgi:hypothetical protein